nr:uncharacterized protein LOC119164137 isoform X1 [Rhipicephalus microplus]
MHRTASRPFEPQHRKLLQQTASKHEHNAKSDASSPDKRATTCNKGELFDSIVLKKFCWQGDLNLKTKCKYFDATKETIQDILRRALLKDGFSSIVQEDIACFVNELHKKWPETGRHFKPMELKCNVLRRVASECKDVLRRCANTNFVAHLMHKHSEIVICIEMALCGTDYVLPAFLLGFKTPMHHVLAGVFLIDFEMLDCMAKAFDLFKARDPYAAITKFWIVEHSEAEINALSSMFPDSRPLLCNFHRAISWSEWQPTTSSDARDISFVKEMLQKVTCSKSDDERRSVLGNAGTISPLAKKQKAAKLCISKVAVGR